MYIKKLVLLNLLCLPFMFLSAQISDSVSANHFVLTIQSFNHAVMLRNGTMSLKMTEDYF